MVAQQDATERRKPCPGVGGIVLSVVGAAERAMAQSDVAPSATAENKIDTLKTAFPPCLQLPGGDGGGFHVAKGKQGARWNPATSRPGTCRGGLSAEGSAKEEAFAGWHSLFVIRLR